MPKRTYEQSGGEEDAQRDKVTKVNHGQQVQQQIQQPSQEPSQEQVQQHAQQVQQHVDPHGEPHGEHVDSGQGHGQVHKDSKIVFYMGFQPSCHLCRAGVPGHYAHWVKS